MVVTVNGNREQMPDGQTVKELLESKALPTDHVAVELNGGIVKRAGFGTTVLSEDDRVEILRFVGGG